MDSSTNSRVLAYLKAVPSLLMRVPRKWYIDYQFRDQEYIEQQEEV